MEISLHIARFQEKRSFFHRLDEDQVSISLMSYQVLSLENIYND